jgi:acylpyruvate hydrolase
MRFATIRTDQGTTAARLDGDVLIPLEAGDVGAMLAAGGTARERDGAPAVPATQADFAPVVMQPGKVICVGLNYGRTSWRPGGSYPSTRPCSPSSPRR